MRSHILTFVCLCSCAVLITAIPVPASDQELDVLQIPLADGKELDVLTIGAKDQEQLIAERNKRTIGLLRELFPEITQDINEQINRLVNTILKTIGPEILGRALNPNLNSGRRLKPSETDNSSNVSGDDDDDDGAGPVYIGLPVELTTFAPDPEFAN